MQQQVVWTETNEMARLVQEHGFKVEPSEWGEFIIVVNYMPDNLRRLLRDNRFRAVRVDGVYIVHRAW